MNLRMHVQADLAYRKQESRGTSVAEQEQVKQRRLGTWFSCQN